MESETMIENPNLMPDVGEFVPGTAGELAVMRVVGRGKHIEFTLDDGVPIESVKTGLQSYLDRTQGRFKGGNAALNLGSRVLDAEAISSLESLLRDNFELTLTGLWCGPDALRVLLAQSPGVSASTQDLPADGGQRPDDRTETLLVRGTCRSGMTVHNNGAVVVMGDVNPGAEISATGDVVIYGRLCGLAHAGSSGAEDSIVVALSIEEPQLRIGRHMGTGALARMARKGVSGPYIATVQDDNIIIEQYTPKSTWMQER